MKRISFLSLIFALAFRLALADTAPTHGVITSLSGKVQIQNKKGKKVLAKLKSTVVEGEHIVTKADSKATLQLFDGSELNISPNTDFQLLKLQKLSAEDKVMEFKLFVGRLFASVKKLASSKSSFEIEAGGVVCGVRGTEYSVFYDPATGKVDVVVKEGTVWSTSNGKTQEFHGGQGGSYLNGIWNNPYPPPVTGNPGVGFITSNPFYGFNGTGSDDFNNPLTDLPGGINGVTGQIKGDGVAGLGAHNLLNLQLGFPQFAP